MMTIGGNGYFEIIVTEIGNHTSLEPPPPRKTWSTLKGRYLLLTASPIWHKVGTFSDFIIPILSYIRIYIEETGHIVENPGLHFKGTKQNLPYSYVPNKSPPPALIIFGNFFHPSDLIRTPCFLIFPILEKCKIF